MTYRHEAVFTRQDFVNHPYLSTRLIELNDRIDSTQHKYVAIRLSNMLRNKDKEFAFVAEVIQHYEEYLRRDFGPKTFDFMRDVIIAPLGLHFGSSFPEFESPFKNLTESAKDMRSALLAAEKERIKFGLSPGQGLQDGLGKDPIISAPVAKEITFPPTQDGLTPRQLLIKQGEARVLRGRGLTL